MSNLLLIMLVGPAGCGKSHLTSTCRVLTGGHVTVSSDKIREMLYGDEAVQKDHAKVFNLAHLDISKALALGQNVVFDATNLVPKHRKDVLDIAKDSENTVKTIAVVYTGSLEKCLAQNQLRSRHVPDDVIENQYNTLHRPGYFPTLEEGFDAVISMDLFEVLVLTSVFHGMQ